MHIIICPEVKIEKKIKLCMLYNLIVFYVITGCKLLKKAGETFITYFFYLFHMYTSFQACFSNL